MRNLKKFLALVLAMMMTLSLLVVANAAPATPTNFTDLDKVSPAYAKAVNVLSALKIIKGDDGFRPGETITRAEVSMILYRVAHNDADESQVKIYKDYDVFPDVQSDKWYAGSVNYCANAGYLKGYPNGSFGPSNEVTGYEVLVMTLRMLGYGQNGEFEGKQGDWRLQAAMYGRKAGLTKQIKEGTLGQAATREMVAEIMFQALQADLVDYNLLQNYYPSNVLIENNEDNRKAYANAIKAGQLTLPLNGNLMYVNYNIVGERAGTSDPFGRPTLELVKDGADDVSVPSYDPAGNAYGCAGKYIVNMENGHAWTGGENVNIGRKTEEAAISIALTPVATYDNAIDECHLTKEINNDVSIYWGQITEILNGEKLPCRDAASGGTHANADGATNADKLDALHTSVKFVNATGRTLEVYKPGTTTKFNSMAGAPTLDDWIFVYVDTFLGKVVGTVDEVKDTAGHTIIEPTATVDMGWNQAGSSALKRLTIANPGGKYKYGDLVLLQTPYADKAKTDTTANPPSTTTTAFVGDGSRAAGYAYPDNVSAPELAPLYPTDVPNDAAMFVDNADVKASAATAKISATDVTRILVTAPTTVRVTIKGTVGAQDAKMGVIGEDGKTYMASNTFLAGRQAPAQNGTSYNKTVLKEYYDVPNGANTNNWGAQAAIGNASDAAALAVMNRGIVNAMIGRTYDLVLDQNGHIVGLKEVLDIANGVGIITSIDAVRVGGGKYVSEVEAFMTDGTTKTFQLLGYANGTGTGGKVLDKMTDSDYGYFKSVTDVDDAWGATGMYTKPDTDETDTIVAVGSLVQFKSLSFDGKTYYKMVDWDQTTDTHQVAMVNGTAATGSAEAGDAAEDLAVNKGEVGNSLGQVKTGVTGTLQAGELNSYQLDDESVVFVAEYEYRYNTSGNNDGSNINKTYKVYEGFKKMPTITGLDGANSNILYQQLGEQTGNEKYVLIYAKDTTKEYTIKAQEKIAVDDSYLVLSRGATYATYSEYNVLKNGVQTTLQVSNANTLVNAAIEATMTSDELLLVTGRNAAGYVTSVTTVKTAATAKDTNARLNTGKLAGCEIITGSADVSYADGVLQTTNDGQYLTLDDNVKVQLVNRDQKTVTEISLDVAMVYATNQENKLNAFKDMVFELNEYGYVCNLYVIE